MRRIAMFPVMIILAANKSFVLSSKQPVAPSVQLDPYPLYVQLLYPFFIAYRINRGVELSFGVGRQL